MAVDKRVIEQWDVKKWRRPDVEYGDGMIWYGPGGEEGEHATEIEYGSRSYTVSEYTYVRGLIEEPEDDFLKTTTLISFTGLAEAIAYVERRRRYKVDRLAEAMHDRPEKFARIAVGYGVAKLAYWGGDEEWVGSLPAK